METAMSSIPSTISLFSCSWIPPVKSLPQQNVIFSRNTAPLFPVSYHLSHLSSPRKTRRIFAGNRAYGGSGGEDYAHERLVCPRPADIPWKKELANSIHLIGIIGASVQIKHLSSGKVLAWTRLGVKKSPTETTWINLTLWDELAHIAFQHVEKGQQVYIAGRLVSDSVEVGQEKPQVYYKVVVQQLNFIEKTLPPVSLYNSDANKMTTWPKAGANEGGSIEELWKSFFSNPEEWWDNRNSKRNPKYPDFKHKDTGEALWTNGKYNPPWVRSQLAIFDSRKGPTNGNEPYSMVSTLGNDEFSNFL